MKVPKLHTKINRRIHYNILDKMCSIHKALDINITLGLSIHIERRLSGVVNGWKQSCLMPLTDTIRTP